IVHTLFFVRVIQVAVCVMGWMGWVCDRRFNTSVRASSLSILLSLLLGCCVIIPELTVRRSSVCIA
ncbi:hypothetical protein HOY82DRAFT_564188, partial [Tuber indicum]